MTPREKPPKHARYQTLLEAAFSTHPEGPKTLGYSPKEAALVQLIDDRQLVRATQWGYCGAKSAHSNLRRAGCSTCQAWEGNMMGSGTRTDRTQTRPDRNSNDGA